MKNLSSKVNLDSIGVNNKDGISILKVYGSTPGVELAKREIYKIVDERTALFLSGGSTPKPLYQILAKEGKLKVGAVAMVDERFGPSFHQNSNEKMIKDTGFLSYLESENIPFYGTLKNKPLEETARDYDETIRYLLKSFPKSIAILGVGKDKHTASLLEDWVPSKDEENLLVTQLKDFPGEFKERTTLTLFGLSMIDLLLVLVFGEDKKGVIKSPPSFFRRENISNKTLLITDQKL